MVKCRKKKNLKSSNLQQVNVYLSYKNQLNSFSKNILTLFVEEIELSMILMTIQK